MNKTFFLTLMICLMMSCTTRNTVITSPDENLQFTLSTELGETTFSIRYKNQVLVENAPLGIDFADGYFGENVSIKNSRKQHVVDDYDLPTGKTSHVHSESNEMKVSLSDAEGRVVEMQLRAFDDGVAYRFVIPEQEGMKELAIRGEKMELRTTGDPILKGMILPTFSCSHENVYTTKPLSEFADSLLIEMPALLSFPEGIYMAVTEAMVVDYAGMMLTTRGGQLCGKLSPRLDDSGLCVTGDLPRRSPWRVFQVTDRAGALLESTILTTLADPCTEGDLSWLNPGTSTWPWWNAYQAPEELKKGDINTINQNFNRYYIDFCAENNIKYHSITGIIDENNREFCWYYNEGSATGQPQPTDNTKLPYPGFDIEALCKYAHEKGVGMRVWVHWKTLNQNMEETFRQYQEWGINGMMIDYMDRDDEEMVAFQKKALELAMKYHLHVQFHGASKPSGLQRTYPCEFTRENTLNYEWYKWDRRFSGELKGAHHDLDIPFTRCLAGPADYHLGSFRAIKTQDFQPSFPPMTTCTRSHSLAMYVVLESALQLISDAPEAYEGQEGFAFLREIPTVWDETRVPLAEVDNYIVVARRSGQEWYIGCIGNTESRDVELPLDFLGEGKYTLTLYRDTEESSEDLNRQICEESSVQASETLRVHLAPCGGFAAKITPVK